MHPRGTKFRRPYAFLQLLQVGVWSLLVCSIILRPRGHFQQQAVLSLSPQVEDLRRTDIAVPTNGTLIRALAFFLFPIANAPLVILSAAVLIASGLGSVLHHESIAFSISSRSLPPWSPLFYTVELQLDCLFFYSFSSPFPLSLVLATSLALVIWPLRVY